jgi:ABC-2 type transport system ATP-binding protein
MTFALETRGLTRFYGEFCALAETNINISPGEIILLSGPNGAGKTTLLLCLSALLRPSAGEVLVGGYDLYQDEIEAKRRLAYVPDVPRFYTELTAWEHLKFIAMAHAPVGYTEDGFEERARLVFEELGLWDARDLYPHNYSRGMRLKLGLALAFIRPFEVLILDEPTSALDVQAAETLRNKLLALQAQGKAILLSTHQVEFAATLNATHWHMDKGRLEFSQ